MSEGAQNPYRIYRTTWILLLIITVMMLAAEALHMPRWFLVVFLVSFMFVKATMIAGNFMHLRHEHRRLVITVGVGILVTSAILLAYITPESASVFEKTLR
jgi:cytochrome c oxidase subunit IV